MRLSNTVLVSPITPLAWQYRPVSIAARDGEQIALAEKHRVNRTPSAASRSTPGVTPRGTPARPVCPNQSPASCQVNRMTLG